MSIQLSQNDEPLNIFYIGGNGGFFLLHLLLLSREYACELEHSAFDDYESWFTHFKENVYALQWGVSDEWKTHENWPNNEQTLISNNFNKTKIFFTCNYLHLCNKLPGKKVIIYTDIKTELRMCLFKQANHFFKNKFVNKTLTRSIVIRNLRLLLSHPREIIDSREYKKGMSNILNQFDIKINLQELVKDPEKILLDNFGLVLNQDQRNHIEKWLSLHPKKLLEKAKLI